MNDEISGGQSAAPRRAPKNLADLPLEPVTGHRPPEPSRYGDADSRALLPGQKKDPGEAIPHPHAMLVAPSIGR